MYPKEAQERIDYLDTYKWDDDLTLFDILHLYPGELACKNDGYYDSRMFRLMGYHTRTMCRRSFGDRHDGLTFADGVRIDIIRIFADGSSLIRFLRPVRLEIWQDVRVLPD